jgi:hypothetical protein
VYENGYGIVVVFEPLEGRSTVSDNLLLSQREDGVYVVGGSPILARNRAVGNRGAAVRVLEYVPRHGERVGGTPLLQENVLQDNGINEPIRGEYHEPPRAVTTR